MSGFDVAMQGILRGELWGRSDWNRPAYVGVKLVQIWNKTISTIMLTMKDGEINAYTPSQCDMFARDWYAVSGGSDGKD